MAALCPGVQYGLSSHQNFGENKDLIFVKLTDSALRAIEEYIKNQNKFNCPSPTIKFVGNDGELSFPRGGGAERPTSFSFSVSSTADMGGPGGSFECLRQGGPASAPLEGLGAIPYKMRVLANEDVYEATRHRMTEAEDKYKNKCTREIKPGQTDIGRKVKVKQSAGRPPLPPPRQREPPALPQPSMRESLMKSTGGGGGGAAPPKAAPPPSAPPPPPPVHSSSNGLSNGLGSNHVSSSRPPPPQQKRPSVPDVARRPLRERLIHLLALRPFKKVELHDRLLKEGVREKKSMMSVLNAISHCKDNCFHLNASMWDEVNEEWPFYTETERQILRRRKPQNRTSPGGGSDGGSSTGSGQSPTSTHPGSPPPPPPVKRPPPPVTAGHNGAGPPPNDGGPPYKRARIAHGHHRPADPPYRQPPENSNPQRRPPTDLRDTSNMNPRSRESPTAVNGHHLPAVGPQPAAVQPPPPEEGFAGSGFSAAALERRKAPRVTSSTQRVARVSPDSQTEGLPEAVVPDVTANGRGEVKVEEAEEEEDEEYPDYQKLYLPISNLEQRRRYKADFNADYAEYKYLHGIVERVSRRFAQLEERLKQQDKNSPTYKDIRKQIVREYEENKKDARQQRAKRRFQYLHDKLSHIKGLVADYDKAGLCAAY